jgi:hypothetical protein
MSLLSKDELGIIIQKVQNRQDLINLLEVFPDQFKPLICEKLFKLGKNFIFSICL